MNFKPKDALIPRIEELVKNSCDFEIKSTIGKEMKKQVKKCLDLNNEWFCIRCLKPNSNKNDPIECNFCKAFRPIKSYHSIFRNHGELSPEDSEKLLQRRDYELETVQNLVKEMYNRQGKEGQSPTPTGDEESFVYAVDSEWYNHWQMFVTNKLEGESRVHKSTIKGVGILDPGMIDNRHLFEQDSQLKQGLVPEKDYTFLEQSVWWFLWERYGGEPIIKRRKTGRYLSIYSEPIDITPEEEYLEV